MTHLTDEQFEDIMQGHAIGRDHLEDCLKCRERLLDYKAIKKKMCLAFQSVQASPDLTKRIIAQVNKSDIDPEALNKNSVRQNNVSGFRVKRWPGLAAAAAILMVLAPLLVYFSASSTAQAELVKIHQHNLTPHKEFFSDDDPQKLAEYFKKHLGFTPSFLCSGQGLKIRGCCLTHFRDQIVGSYVVGTPKGIISIIVVTDTPESMGLSPLANQADNDQVYWKGHFAKCNMITVRIDDYSYCAVGEVSYDLLTDLIKQLIK